MARSQFALSNFRTDYHWSGQYLLGSKMAENLSKRPKRGILKSSTSFEQREYSPAPPVEPNFQQQRAPPSATGLLTTTYRRLMKSLNLWNPSNRLTKKPHLFSRFYKKSSSGEHIWEWIRQAHSSRTI